jgi:hypothetical protein
MYRRAKRYSKVSGGSKTPWLIFNPHSGEAPLSSKAVGFESKWVQVAAIDPAVKNCAIRIERRTFSEEGEVLSIETIVQKKIDFLESQTGPQEDAASNYYVNSTVALSRMMEYFASCHYIIIESQMPVNTEMTRMGQHIISILMFSLKDCGVKPLIVEIDPKIKSLGAGRMTKPELKKWAAAKAVEILRGNGDESTADFIQNSTKRDDHGDVVCYTTAWFKILKDGGIVHALPKCNENARQKRPTRESSSSAPPAICELPPTEKG